MEGTQSGTKVGVRAPPESASTNMEGESQWGRPTPYWEIADHWRGYKAQYTWEGASPKMATRLVGPSQEKPLSLAGVTLRAVAGWGSPPPRAREDKILRRWDRSEMGRSRLSCILRMCMSWDRVTYR